ncbi:MAG: hypothetical protein ACR2QK_04650, partial [Acidimicrobiales bacterium]
GLDLVGAGGGSKDMGVSHTIARGIVYGRPRPGPDRRPIDDESTAMVRYRRRETLTDHETAVPSETARS